MSVRPPQRIFNEQLVPKSLLDTKKMRMPESKDFIVYKKQTFRNGFTYKSFPIKQIQMDNVRPTIEEVQNFATYISKNVDKDDPSEITGEELIKRTFLSANNSDINKGDKIRVIKGDLNGLYGSVITIENGDVLFKPNIEGFDENLKLSSDFVVKYFEPGDHIRIIDGKFKGETGIVVSIEGKYANIALT
jgi:transcription elongation factor SPT5